MKNKKFTYIIPVVCAGALMICSAKIVKADSVQSSSISEQSIQSNNQHSQYDSESTNAVQKYPEMGPGYYSLSAIENFIAITQPSPFLNLYATSAQRQAFLNTIKPYIIALHKSGVLPSVAAAQAAIESGDGKSGLAISGNNLFGIKGYYNGQSVGYWTSEWSASSGWYRIKAPFKKYPNWATSIQDYGNLMHTRTFSNVLNKSDYRQVASLLRQDGYATSPYYVSSIISVVESYNLQSWDSESVGVTQESEDIAKIVYVPGYGVLGFNLDGTSIAGSNLKFKDGSRWKTWGSKIINGEEMYDVGGGEYVPKKYTDHYDNGVITINYIPDYGVNAVRSDGTQIAGSNLKFKTGTSWKIVGVKEINGEMAYLVGNDTYILKKYTQWGSGK